MKLLVDMNLSPEWVEALEAEGVEAVHWSKIGSVAASDKEIMAWAKSSGRIVLTHDLDFGAVLAATEADAPSVLQLRFQDLAPANAIQLVLRVLNNFRRELEQGGPCEYR
jgi:predicted nuclease of predicted toxin-antitoxin system